MIAQPLFIVLLVFICGGARRGAGGLFVQYGITKKGDNSLAHGLGAALVALVLSAMVSAFHWFGIFALCWYFFTKPTPHRCFRTIDGPTATFRAWAYAGSAFRLSLITPLALAVHTAAQGLHYTPGLTWLAMLGLLPLPYWLGGIWQRSGTVRDAVEFGEWGYCLIGVMLAGIASGTALPGSGWALHHIYGFFIF